MKIDKNSKPLPEDSVSKGNRLMKGGEQKIEDMETKSFPSPKPSDIVKSQKKETD